jgi:thymidylate synthase
MFLDLIFSISNEHFMNTLLFVNNNKNLLHFNKILNSNPFEKNTIVLYKYNFLNEHNLYINHLNHNIIIIDPINNLEHTSSLSYKTFDDFINQSNINQNIFVICQNTYFLDECLIKYKNLVKNIYYNVIDLDLDLESNSYSYYIDEPIDYIYNKILGNEKEAFINTHLIDSINKNIKHRIKDKDIEYFHIVLPIHEEHQYLNLLKKLILNGNKRQTRNSITYSLFNETLSFDLKNGFPLLTTKKMFIRGIFEELIFFLKGQTNTKILEEKGINIWKGNTSNEFLSSMGFNYKEGDMGPMYGFLWKHYGCGSDYTGFEKEDYYQNRGIDQIENVLNLLLTDSYSRRILLTSYDPSVVNKGVLYPCHSIIIQFYVTKVNNKLMVSMNMYQRSVDFCCGIPFNIASNAFLLHLICNTLNYRKGENIYYPDILNIIMGDIHIYENHTKLALEQCKRVPYTFPTIEIINKHNLLENYNFKEDIIINDYNSHSSIKYEMIP